MEWSADRVLDFGARPHAEAGPIAHRRFLLWPARAWRVVVPYSYDRKLNSLQRVIVRLALAGQRDFKTTAKLIGVNEELVALVAEELQQMDMLTSSLDVSKRGQEALEDSVPAPKDLQVGWVFQDTRSGKLEPRFVLRLQGADVVTSDDGGKKWPEIRWGTKGSPRRDRAFVLPSGGAPALRPAPEEILEAVERHKRHERRAARAEEDGSLIAPEAPEHVSFVADYPEEYHILTQIYVPVDNDYGTEPWYVAEPFGFGASPAHRALVDQAREESHGVLRDLLDSLTGERDEKRRAAHREVQEMLREQAREFVAERLPRGRAEDDPIRERLELAVAEVFRLDGGDSSRRDPIDTALLRLRQALELLVAKAKESGGIQNDAGRRVSGQKRDALRKTLRVCGEQIGLDTPLPKFIEIVRPGQIQAVFADPTYANFRPVCAALILCAAAAPDLNPFARLAGQNPAWLANADKIYNATSEEIHPRGSRDVSGLEEMADQTIGLCWQLLEAFGR